MIHRELSELFEKLINNQCSEEEADLIMELLSDESNARLFRTLIAQQLKQPLAENSSEGVSESVKRSLNIRLEQILQATPPPRSNRFRNLTRSIGARYAAAAVFLLLAVMTYLLVRKAPSQPAVVVRKNMQPIVAGTNKAILTLSDGRQINLDATTNGEIATQSNAVVKKMANGVIVYEAKAEAPALKTGVPEFNTISTPKGGQYMVVLPDGSKVWLNAASSLKYPARFDAEQRLVELTGEGYFEIEKNGGKAPFIVMSNHQRIEVLGTMFNVNAYTEESCIRTTLLNGGVRVSALNDNYGGRVITAGTLRPGEQSELSGNGLVVSEGNTEAALAWKNGNFQFENEDIHVIMRKIARWYDVDVEYHGSMKGKILSGVISKYKSVQEVLKMMEITETVSFTIKDRKIEVF